ncbi:lantibiotic dehydratase [Kitasatospora sp. NPDC059795]|uniref:lantibiotic dehydratase n=1 Tax=Kitasatospora sp. NPDC059795 TaxID=3346949 RepID=UPI003646A512
MKNTREPWFRAWDVFLLRAPAEARGSSLTLRDGVRGLGPEAGREAYLALLTAFAADPLRREAVRLASPDLARTVERAADGRAEGIGDERLRRAALTALRYDIRLRTRPTPFGLFAGVADGRFDSSAKVEWDDRGPHHRTHADMDWLLGLVRELELDAAVLERLPVRTHAGAGVQADRVVLDTPANLGVAAGTEGRGSVSVRWTPAVRAALDAARTPVAFGALVGRLRELFPTAPEAAVRSMLHGLVDQELLVTGLRPPLDGGDPLVRVIEVLASTDPAPDSAACVALTGLREVARLRDAYDATAPGHGGPALSELLAAQAELRPHRTSLHLDTRLGARVRLPESVRSEVERAVDAMWRLSPVRLGMRPLRPYQEAFLEKYGVGRPVPLKELLDETNGLGAPGGYKWPNAERPESDAPEPRDRDREQLLAALHTRAVRDGRREVVLDEQTVEQLSLGEPDPSTVQPSCELFLHVVSPSEQALSDGEFRLVLAPNPGSHQAGATIGRFADLLDEHVARTVAERCAALEPLVPGALPVNLAYQPRSPRAANIAHTPALTGRRIGIGLPEAEGAEELRLDDIAVGSTLDRMYAVHLPTMRELAPTAHSMLSPGAQAPNAARLLWEIGQEGHRLWEPFDWGQVSPAPFLPRVRYGRVVLCAATWKLTELRRAAERIPAADAAGWAGAVARWRADWRVPDRILALSNDQRLELRLDDPWDLLLLRDELRKDPQLVAQETPDASCADGWFAGRDGGPGGGHLVELVVPLERAPGLPRPLPLGRLPRPTAPDRPRQAGPGSDWLYLKAYGSWRGQDQLVRSLVPELAEAARQTGADRWFFIRYRDPDYHLRLRFHGDPEVLWKDTLPRLSRILTDRQVAGFLSHFTVDSYDPEWERYGGPHAQQAAEEYFQADSLASIALLDLAAQPRFPYSGDQLATVAVAAVAHAFGAPSPGTPWAGGPYADDPAAAWLAATGDRRDVPPHFRSDRARWRALIDPVGGWPRLAADEAGQRVLAALRERDATAARYGATIRRLTSEGRCATSELRIVGSLIHMTCNRLFGGVQEREGSALAIARAAVLDHHDRRRHRA